MVKVLVTGGAGYIGSHAVASLNKHGHDVIVLDNLVFGHREIVENILKVPLIVGSVGDKELLDNILKGTHPLCKGEEVEAVMHFAAYTYVGESVKDPIKYYQNNVIESFNLLKCLIREQERRSSEKEIRIPIIFSSSCATYGIPENLPINEDHLQKPIHPYGKTKLIIEEMLKDLWLANQLPSVIFRYFNAAGADLSQRMGEQHDPETHLIPLAIEAALNKNKLLNLFGDDYPTIDGTCIRDYVHVVDLAEAHVKGLEKVLKNTGHFIYNLGTGKGYSVNQIISEVEEIAKGKIQIKICGRREGDQPVLFASAEKAFNELSWVPKYSGLKTIIESAYNWYRVINKSKNG